MMVGYQPHIIVVVLCVMKGEYDDLLCWPVKVKVRSELLNWAGDHHHEAETEIWQWNKDHSGNYPSGMKQLIVIDYPKLERQKPGELCFVKDDCFQLRIQITVG